MMSVNGRETLLNGVKFIRKDVFADVIFVRGAIESNRRN